MQRIITHSKIFTLFFSTLFLICAESNAQPEELDLTFNTGEGPNLGVYTTAQQADGKIVIGGAFSSFNGINCGRIARINSDGSLDTSFDPGVGITATNVVYTTALQQDGKILLGGNFTVFDGVPRNSRMVRLNEDGSLDQSFIAASGTFFSINNIIAQADGKILIAGWFDNYNGSGINNIARLNEDGTIDPTFNPGASTNNPINIMLPQADGRIIIGGNFISFNGVSRARIARINSDGSLDPSFDPGTGFDNSVLSLAHFPDGKILVGGRFTTYNGTARRGIIRLNPEGSNDSSFDPGSGAFNGSPNFFGVASMVVLPDNKILIGGDFPVFNGIFLGRLVCLNEDGSTFDTFLSAFAAEVRSIQKQSDGKILIAGDFNTYNTWQANRIVRLNLDGGCEETTAVDIQNQCGAFTWIDGNLYSSNNNTATFTLQNSAGCDSIVTLNLTINTLSLSVSQSGNTLTANETNATYRWLDCNNNNTPIENATAQSFTPSQSGNYAVEITKNGCTEVSACIQVTITSIETLENSSTSFVFPNPANHYVSIALPDGMNSKQLKLLDASGRIVHSSPMPFSSEIKTIDISMYENGLYLLIIEFENGHSSINRIIKQ